MPRLAALSLAVVLSGCLPAPFVVRVDAQPEAPITTDDLVFEVEVDGEPRGLELALTRDDPAIERALGADDLVAIEQGETFARYRLVISAADTARDQTWTLRAVASRGRATSTAEATVTVLNAAPSVSVVLAPQEPTSLDTLRALATVEDLDGDPTELVYRWSVNGEAVFNPEPELPSGNFGSGDVVEVRVFARDHADASDPVVARATIANLPPGPAGLAIEPELAAPNVPIVCRVVSPAIDPDGDSVHYRFDWFVDGEPWRGGVDQTDRPGDTIAPTATSQGQRWTCVGTPTDGVDDGPPTSVFTDIATWQGPRHLSTCGAEGAQGPDEAACALVYADEPLAAELQVVDGVQRWTAPIGALYRIEVAGARGGHGQPEASGGAGAIAGATVRVAQGETLAILVGQAGEDSELGSGGGGGGTFVARFREGAWEPMVVAGGGGGASATAEQDGCPGMSERTGGRGSGNGRFSTCDTRSEGLGLGGATTGFNRGAGGGGFSGSGADDGFGSWISGRGGASFSAGGLGGVSISAVCSSAPAHGGFGGGGAGQGCPGGGGGGGYSGGDGGTLAGGGGSIALGDDTIVEAGANPEPHGWVTIDLAPVPEG